MRAGARFLVRGLAVRAVLLVVVCSCAYLLAAATLDPRGNYEGQSPPPPPDVVEATLAERNLNDRVPLAQRYLTWASGVLAGDLGSTWDGRSVNDEMARRVGVSVRLLVLGAVAGSVAGVLVGAWTGSRRNGPADVLATLGAVLVISVPVVVLAEVLQVSALWGNRLTGMDLLRTAGASSVGGPTGVGWELADRARYMVLPTIALALPQAAVVSRYQRGAMAEAAAADFVRTARAKGLTRATALRAHALRTALIPAVTYFGYSAAALFTGAVFVEKVFGRHGVGELLFDAIARGDVNVVAAVASFGALCVLAAGLLVDTAHVALDPRLRTG